MLGVIPVVNDKGLRLGKYVEFPFNGGLLHPYCDEEELYAYADDEFGIEECGYLVIAVQAVDSPIEKYEILGTAYSLEDVIQRYGTFDDVMYKSVIDTEKRSALFVTHRSEWNMDLSNVYEHYGTNVEYIVTRQPRKVIEKRGVKRLGPGWIASANRKIVVMGSEEIVSQVCPGYVMCGSAYVSHKARELLR